MAEFLQLFVKGFWNTLAEMSPYLLFGFFVAGVLSVFISAGIWGEGQGLYNTELVQYVYRAARRLREREFLA